MGDITTGLTGARLRMAQARKEMRVLMCGIVVCATLIPMRPFVSLQVPLFAIMLALSLTLVVVSVVGNKEPFNAHLIVAGAALFVYLIVRMTAGGGGAGERLFQCALMVSVLIGSSRFEWGLISIRAFSRAMSLIVVASAIYWLVSGRITNYYASFYGHSNGFSNMLICAVVVRSTVIVSRNDCRIGVADVAYYALCALLLGFANSRSAILAVVVAVGSFAIIQFFGKKGLTAPAAIGLFLGVVAIMLALSVIYPLLYGTPLGVQLELLSREYLNKNFFSGREVVWSMVLRTLEGHEAFGLGLGMVPSMIYDTGFSSHNLYLQTMLQGGVVGLVLVLSILFVAVILFSNHGSSTAYIGIALIVGILVHEGFEVTLTQNNFSYGIMYWLVLGMLLSASRKGSVAR